MFRLLGAHPGPDFRTAAAAALADLPTVATRRLLAVLVRAHLLYQVAPDRFRRDGARTTDLAAARRVLRWYLDSLRTTPGFFEQEERNLRAAVDLKLAREHANLAWEAHWLVECGHVLIALDDLPGALVAFQRAAMLHRCHGDRGREATAHDGTGTVYRLMGPGDVHRLAVAAFQDTGERWLLALALDHLAQAVAEQHWREAADLLEAFPDPCATRR